MELIVWISLASLRTIQTSWAKSAGWSEQAPKDNDKNAFEWSSQKHESMNLDNL